MALLDHKGFQGQLDLLDLLDLPVQEVSPDLHLLLLDLLDQRLLLLDLLDHKGFQGQLDLLDPRLLLLDLPGLLQQS